MEKNTIAKNRVKEFNKIEETRETQEGESSIPAADADHWSNITI